MDEKKGVTRTFVVRPLKDHFIFVSSPNSRWNKTRQFNLEEKKKSQDFCILIFQRFKYPNISFLFSQFPSLEFSALDNTKSEDFFIGFLVSWWVPVWPNDGLVRWAGCCGLWGHCDSNCNHNRDRYIQWNHNRDRYIQWNHNRDSYMWKWSWFWLFCLCGWNVSM